MKSGIVWQLIMLIGFIATSMIAGCTAELAAKADKKPDILHLKVDFAAPSGKDSLKPIPNTAKNEWWHWVLPDWDFYRSDLKWEDGSSTYPKDGPGIAGTGVHAAITCHYEGIMSIYVAGMRRYLAGGIKPEKKPIYEPICNTWIAGSDFPDNPTSDILLAFYDLLAGKYMLRSYHNSFNCRRFGDDPTGVECTQTKQPEPPMSSIRVYSINSLLTDYFKSTQDALIKGRTYGTSEEKIIVHSKRSTGKVKQTRFAKNIVIQQVKTDAELKPSIIEFTTDGSPVIIVYAGGCCKSDDLRSHRKGGYPVLNAFELLRLSDEIKP